MSSRRTVILLIAIVLAAVAAVVTYLWLQGVQDRAYRDAELVRVFRVERDIPRGTGGDEAISQEAVRPDRAPREFRPGAAITDLDSIRGRVALTDLSAGQIVVEGMFVDPRVAQVTAAQRIPAGQVAVSVSLDQVRAVGGLLVPGDKVNIMVPDPADTETTQRMLFQNVDILFIGTTAAPEAGETEAVEAPSSGVITFAVPPLAAEKIALATKVGDGLWLTLVPPDNQPVPVPPVGHGNLFQGGLTPYEG